MVHRKEQFGIDIDGNGGKVVSPWNIANSDKLELVQSFGFDITDCKTFPYPASVTSPACPIRQLEKWVEEVTNISPFSRYMCTLWRYLRSAYRQKFFKSYSVRAYSLVRKVGSFSYSARLRIRIRLQNVSVSGVGNKPRMPYTARICDCKRNLCAVVLHGLYRGAQTYYEHISWKRRYICYLFHPLFKLPYRVFKMGISSIFW